MSDVIVAPNVRDLDTLRRQLTGWFDQKLPDARDIRIHDLAYPRGAGQSHETILMEASWSEGPSLIERGYVVRIKPTNHTVYPDDLFHEQFRLMRALHAAACVPVARAIWFEEDPGLFGAPFFVMEKMVGRVAVTVPPYAKQGWVVEATPAERAKLWENGVRALAGIQAMPLDSLTFLEGLTPGAERGLEQEWDKYARFAAWVQEDRPWPVLDRALDRLRASWPVNQPDGLVWGDARLGNLMFDENFEVVVVMDWEQPSLGGALHDLAWWVQNAEMMYGTKCRWRDPDSSRPLLEGMGTREETIALWREVTGIPTDDLEWYEDFVLFKYACLSIRSAKISNSRMNPMPTEAELTQFMKL